MNPNQTAMPSLISEFDREPGPWLPFYYGVIITVGVNQGDRGIGSLRLNNEQYLWTALTHQIVGETQDGDTTGLYQDGQVTIAWRDEDSNYTNIDLPIEAALGSCRTGQFLEFPYPVGFWGTKTLTFELVNQYNRVLTSEATTFRYGLVMHGIRNRLGPR